MSWTFDDFTPVYIQLVDRIRLDILNGVYAKNSQIPSVRQLAYEAAVNPNTMQRALSELESEGLLCSRGTSGRFVTDDADILKISRDKAARKLITEFIGSAARLSIAKAELIRMIEESDEL